MKIVDKLRSDKPAFSFEFFPPKNEAGKDRLFETVKHLAPYEPTFVSVTYGAGGSTRKLTLELVTQIERAEGLDAMAHLTCVGATKDEIREILDELAASGVENVLALRGDPPKGQEQFVVTEGGFAHASELAAFMKANWTFCIGGACYPEVHPEATDPETDMRHLKAKVDAGVEFLVTQLFFDEKDYFAFVKRARDGGISCPILAGIMPITNLNQVKRFTKMCGANIPAPLLADLEATGGEADAVSKIGVEHATAQCRALLDGGAPGIHFYTLNRSPATVRIMEALR